MEKDFQRIEPKLRITEEDAVPEAEMNYQEEMIKGLQRDNLVLRREVKSANNRSVAMTALALVSWVIATLMVTQSAEASEGRNWCADWTDGYVTGLCWSKLECEIPPELECPSPLDGQRDGYMVGLNTGLSDGEE